MKIKALRTIRTDVGNVRRGDEADLPATVAKSLIDRKLAEAVRVERARPRKKPHVAAQAAPSKPEKTGA